MKEQLDKAPKQRTPRWIIILCIAIVAVPLFYFLYSNALSNRVKAKLNAISAAGYPVTLEELNDWYVEPPPGQNAADMFLQAFSDFKEPAEEYDQLPFFTDFELPSSQEPLSDETKKQIAKFLAENHEMLKSLQQAVAIKHCRYPLDLTEGIALILPDIVRARSASWLLCFKALLHAENNEATLAVESLIASLGVAHSFVNEPLLISQLIRIGCQETTVSNLERVLQRTQFTDEQLAKLTSALAGAQDTQAMLRAVAGERCVMSDLFSTPDLVRQFVSSDSIINSPLLLLYNTSGLLEHDYLCYLDLTTKSVRALELPLHERLQALKAVEDELHDLPSYRILTRALFSSPSRVVQMDLRTIADLRTSLVAIAVQRYRLAHDELPENLSQLVPTYLDTIPKDPFDGHPLRYKKLPKGYVVYSVSHDGKDDGGKEVQRGDPDIAFTIQW